MRNHQYLCLSFLLLLGGNHHVGIPLAQAFRVNRSLVSRKHFRGGAQSTTAIGSDFSVDSSSRQIQRSITEAGGVITTTTSTPTATTSSTTKAHTVRNSNRSSWIVGSTLVFSLLIYQQRAIWLPLLDKDLILQRTLELLEPLQSNRYGWLYYSMGLAIWEFCGLSTIPVETAAGMVLGWKAVGASLLGKMTGAMVAFGVGRCWLYQHISTQLQHNEIFQLINQASSSSSTSVLIHSVYSNTTTDRATTTTSSVSTLHAHSPLLTAFLMKFSCFPEMVKNFGSSLLPVLTWWMFAAATFVHGGIFTVLWTWLGQQQSSGATAKGSTTIALGIAAFMGLVVTPAVMAWWIRDLKRWADLNQKILTNSNNNNLL